MTTGRQLDARMEAPPVRRPPITNDARRRARLTLLLLVLVCSLPVIASYLAFYVWQPDGRVNHGELITPAALPATTLAGLDGQPALTRQALEGRWTLVYAGAGRCEPVCEASLHAMRQARLAQGKEQARVTKLWLLDGEGPPVATQISGQSDLRLARAGADWLAQLPGAAQGRYVYLVDPRGNVMMRFDPAVPEQDATEAIRGMVKDLQRLLKYSALGRSGGG